MEVVIHGIYRHRKGGLYIVEDIATHSETMEQVVVYRALYGDKKLWVRPYNMFISIDNGIPRFTLIDIGKL